MKIYTDIRLWMVTLLFLLMAGCSDDNASVKEPVKGPVETDRSSFMMYVYLPNGSGTRSADDDRSIYIDRPFEGIVNSLRVWVFARDAQDKLTPIREEAATTNGVLYDNVGSIDSSVSVTQVAFDVEDGFIDKYPKLDVYVIANIESLGIDEGWCSPQNSETLQDVEDRLEALQLTSTQFGLDNRVSDASTYGLPMSGYLKHASVTKQGVLYSTTMSIKVKRAVSKLRFVFAKSSSTPDAQVTSVKLNTGMIPTTEYLFSGTAAENGVSLNETYTGSFYGEINFGAVPSTSIKTNVLPSSLKWDSSVGRQKWEDALNDAIKKGEATEFGRAYLHESPQQLTGTIYYKMTAGDIVEKSVKFKMADGDHFLRNRSWTVYAYFSGGGLVYEVADWDDEEVTFKPFI